jgi:uncharacterized protein YciI
MAEKHYLLIYDAVENYVERRTAHRAAHIAAARASQEIGELVLAGALADPIDGSVFLFKCETDEPVRRFAESDPYVVAGLIRQWRIREWTTVIGDAAANKMTP